MIKRIITFLIFLIFASFTIDDVSARGEEILSATFNVEKMTCATCPITVRKAIQRVDGVKEVTVDYDSKTATVTYDSSLTDTKLISDSSSNVGFPATLIEGSIQ
jgi:mercuric ion binding protein